MLTKIALNLPDAEHVSGLSRSFLYREIKLGALKAIKVGGRRLILMSDLEAYLRSHTHANAA